MHRALERIQNSPVLLAALGAAILVAVAASVFVVGNLLTNGDGTELTTEDVTTTTPARGETIDDNSSGNGDETDGNTDGGDPDDRTDFCEAATRNNFEIRFDPGESSNTDGRVVPAGQVDLYRLEVAADQILTVIVASPEADLVAQVEAPDRSVIRAPSTGMTIAPTQAGIYRICLSPAEVDARYDLTVAVVDDNKPSKVAAPWCGTSVYDRGEIRFVAGASSGSVEEGVIRGERDLYRFDADDGQAIDLLLDSLEDNAVFDLRAPDGEVLITEVSDFRTPLPMTGTYQICVGSIRGNASYELSLTIG